MPTPTKGPRLGGTPAHQRIILANLATSLFQHGSITTTEAKARRLRPFAERLISKAKRGDLHNRRQVLSVIQDKTVVHVLFTEIGPRYAERPGGYTRITKIGPRKGDNAPMAVIALVEEPVAAASRPASSGAAPAPARGASPRGASAPAATPAESVESAVTDETTEPAVGSEDAEPAVVPQSAQTEDAGSVDGQVDEADEQVAAQDAVAAQEPHGDPVVPAAGGSDVTSGDETAQGAHSDPADEATPGDEPVQADEATPGDEPK